MKKSVSIMFALLILITGLSVFGQGQSPEKLTSGTYIVYAKSPQVWRFIVDPKTMANATVSGHFAISAGNPKNIDVFVFNEENMTKYRSDDDAVKAGAKPVFASGRKPDGDLNVKLTDGGVYYLVFSNSFQYEGTKTLVADVKLTYDKK